MTAGVLLLLGRGAAAGGLPAGRGAAAGGLPAGRGAAAGGLPPPGRGAATAEGLPAGEGRGRPGEVRPPGELLPRVAWALPSPAGRAAPCCHARPSPAGHQGEERGRLSGEKEIRERERRRGDERAR